MQNLTKIRQYQLNNPTPFEILFENKLRKSNIRYKKQKEITGYLADFFLPQFNLVVEIDGAAHYNSYNLSRDRKRDDTIRQHGFSVHRIRNSEVFDYEKEDLINAAKKFENVASTHDHSFFKSYLASL